MATHTRNLRVRVQEYLPQLKSREMTNREAAELLGVNEQHLSRTLTELNFVKDPAQDRKAQTELNRQRKKFREHVANTMTPEDAAKAAGVSVRTIYRYIRK